MRSAAIAPVVLFFLTTHTLPVSAAPPLEAGAGVTSQCSSYTLRNMSRRSDGMFAVDKAVCPRPAATQLSCVMDSFSLFAWADRSFTPRLLAIATSAD
jgi:hypothetical protein